MPELRLYRFPEWQETPYKFVLLKRGDSGLLAPRGEPSEPVEREGRLSESLSRSRRLIQEYILCNPFQLFCTFTFDESRVRDRKDYKALKARLAKSFNNFKNRCDQDFRYLIVPELHKDGAVHFHGVITEPPGLTVPEKIPKRDIHGKLRMVPNTKGYMDWPYYSSRFGYFSCSWIRDYVRCANYVSKYMTKDIADWFERGDQIVMHSKGLIRPELVDIYYDRGIPGGIDASRGDFDGDFCATAMRTVAETSRVYFNADESMGRYNYLAPDDYEALRRSRPQHVDAGPVEMDYIPDAFLGYLPPEWRTQGNPRDEYEQTSMYALNMAYGDLQ